MDQVLTYKKGFSIHKEYSCSKTILERIRKPIRLFIVLLALIFMKLFINEKSSDTLIIESFSKKKEFFDLNIVSKYQCFNSYVVGPTHYNSEDFNIDGCYFIMFSTKDGDEGNGGVIYFKDSENAKRMSIRSSGFYNASSRVLGGAIYYQSQYVSLYMVCGNSCFSGDSHFAILITTNGGINFLSISECSKNKIGKNYMYMKTGDIPLENSNVSKNSIRYHEGIKIESKKVVLLKYCSFVRNNMCMYFYVYIFQFEYTESNFGMITYSNFINNDPNQDSNGAVIRVFDKWMNITESVFYQNNYVLLKSNKILNLVKCSIDHSYSKTISGSYFTSIDCTFGISNTFQIRFYQTYNCHADIPIPLETPGSTPLITPHNTPPHSLQNTPSNTLFPTIPISPIETPYKTFDPSPLASKIETPYETVPPSPLASIKETPFKTVPPSPLASTKETSVITLCQSPIDTLMFTLHCSPDATQSRTLLQTIPKSEAISIEFSSKLPLTRTFSNSITDNNNTNSQKKTNSILYYSFAFLVIVIAMIGVTFCFSHRSTKRTNEDFSESSLSGISHKIINEIILNKKGNSGKTIEESLILD